jgi:hypothetical protein
MPPYIDDPAWMTLSFGIVLIVGAMVGLVRTVRSVSIGVTGRPAVATVVGPAGRRWDGYHGWSVDYTTAGGERHTGVTLLMDTDAPHAGTPITIHHDPRHPQWVQPVRWDWERIVLTGVIGVPAGMLYGIGYVSFVTFYALGDAIVPLLGVLAGVLLAVATALAPVRAPGGRRAMFTVAAVAAAMSLGHILVGLGTVIFAMIVLIVEVLGARFVTLTRIEEPGG